MKKILLSLSTLIVASVWAGWALAADAGVVIELKGSAKSVHALLADLEKEAVYKDAACSLDKKSGKTTKVICATADGALLNFLSRNAPTGVRWSISGTATQVMSVTRSCPTGCALKTCNGVTTCFNRSCAAC